MSQKCFCNLTTTTFINFEFEISQGRHFHDKGTKSLNSCQFLPLRDALIPAYVIYVVICVLKLCVTLLQWFNAKFSR